MGEQDSSFGNPERQTIVIRPAAVGSDTSATMSRGRRPGRPQLSQVLVLAVTLAVVTAGGVFIASIRSSLAVDGIVDGQRLTRRDLGTLTIRITSAGAGTDDVLVQVNGSPVPVSEDAGDLVVGAAALSERIVDGDNTLVVSRPGRFGIGGASVEREFTYDPVGPRLLVAPAIVSAAGRPVVLRGLVDGATALTANGLPVDIEPGGAFTLEVSPGTTAVALGAREAAGNAGEATVTVGPAAPAADHPATAAVHVSARGWMDPAVREPILAMARSGLINAVQLDIKDEAGQVGYASAVPLAATTGAARGHYDVASALDELHRSGVRVIGRIVCFLDPVLAAWAWENDRSDMLVLQGSGGPLATDDGTASFTNVANPGVRQYLIDLAVEAVSLGFDEVLYDYVRRPEGDTGAMYFPGLETAADVAVARFVADTNAALAGTDAEFGVSVFGIAATRPQQVAQDLRLLAPHVDYVAPMVYPSHWGPGDYAVADPNRQPGDIVAASIADFHRLIGGSGAAVVPWLQDFSAGGVAYGPVEVRAQIDAALATGATGFLLWNSGSFYTAEALQPPPLVS